MYKVIINNGLTTYISTLDKVNAFIYLRCIEWNIKNVNIQNIYIDNVSDNGIKSIEFDGLVFFIEKIDGQIF